jgi:ATP-dependent helicase/nuclease subunit A
VGGVTQRVAEELDALAAATSGARTLDTLRALIAALPDVSSKSGWLGRLGEWAKGGLNQREDGAFGDALELLSSEASELRRAIQAVAGLDPDLLAAAHRLIGPLLADVEEELRKRGVATFASLLRGARDLLVEQPSIARRLRSRMRQVLVDEFQDTDPLQCEILAELALAAPKEERPGLFLVGDPKQSIYGWRSADLAAYARFVARVLEEGGERHPLTVNFRSVPDLLAEVERVIAPVMEPVEGLQPEFQPLLVCEARAGDRGFEAGDHQPVEHWVTWSWDEESGPAIPNAESAVAIEASAVAADIGRLHRDHGVGWGEIALLFRSSGDLGSYLEAFRRVGVPFVVEGDRDYYRRREVVEAAALVRCIVDPSDVLALLAVIRSSMAGVPDAALLPLWRQRLPALAARLFGDETEPLAELADAVARAVADLPPDVEGLDAVQGWDVNLVACLEDVAALRASFAEAPADLFVETLRTRLLFEAGEASRRPGLYRIANLDRFFRDLETSLEDGEGDPSAILRILRHEVAERREAEEGRPKEAVEDAVQVMTIHKSKGLDFNHVYVVQLHKGTGHGRQNRAESTEAGCFEYQLLGAATPGYSQLERRAQAVSAVERVRTLYVALTRARERLVVVGVRDLGAKAARAASHAELLTQRSNAPVDLEQDLCDAVAAGASGFVDGDGVRWVAPGLPSFADAAVLESASSDALFEETALEDGWRTLVAARSEASERMARGYSSAVSALAHEALRDAHRAAHEPREEEGEPRPPRDARPVSREGAMFVGTAVHRALERLDPAADATAEQARILSDLEDELMRSLPGGDREAAHARARELVEGFFAGPLFARLRELAADVVARELPVLLPPEAGDGDGPVGFFAGAVDLVYRDARSGGLVVVDYKTDRIASPADLDEKAALYATQGAGYVSAVQQALALPEAPRFEFWFLDAGEIRVI